MGNILTKRKKILLLFLFFLSLVFYLVMINFHLRDIFMFDEVMNSKSAEMIASSSRPAIYYWKNGDKPYLEILAHPALYINILALLYKAFGTRELVARLLGVICVFIDLLLIILISRKFFHKENKGFWIGLSAASLFFINPLLVRGSLVLDIDTTILAPCLLFFVFLALKSFRQPAKSDILSLSLLFALCVWAKETAIAVLVPAVFFYLLFAGNQKPRAIWLKWAGVFFLGFSIFFLTWWLYCRLLNLPAHFPFEYTILSKVGLYLSSGLYPRIATLRNDAFWLSPFLFILFILSCWRRYAESQDFLLILGIWILAFYTLIMPTTVIPKYVFILVPIFSIAAAAAFFEIYLSLNRKAIFLISLVFLACFAYYQEVIPEPLLILQNREVVLNKITLILLYILPLFILEPILKKLIKQSAINALVMSAVVLFVASGMSLVIKQSQADYATFYHYGERGLKETINYVKGNIDQKAILFGRKEFEYYLPQRTFFDFTGNTRILKQLIDHKKINYAIFSDYYEGEKELSAWLDKTYKRVYTWGNFSVYRIE